MTQQTLKAYRLPAPEGWTLEPAPRTREWMDGTPDRHAYKCLPLVIANQAGWIIRCPGSFKVTWNGKSGVDALKIELLERPERLKGGIVSIFGHGILSIAIPYLFRTPKGVGLWVRGPSNEPRSDIAPLDGIVETDWAPYTFTMNWKLTRRNSPVWFREGEPIVLLTPVSLDLYESLEPEYAELASDPELEKQHREWVEARNRQNRAVASGDSQGGRPALRYVRGEDMQGSRSESHRSRLAVRKFSE